MVKITPDVGLERDGLPAYMSELGAVFRLVFGADLTLESETPQGQFIGEVSLWASQFEEAVIHVANGTGRDYASGYQLDYLNGLLVLDRIEASKSTAVVTLTGQSGTMVASGALVRSESGDLWSLVSDVSIGVSGAQDGVVQARETGPVEAAAEAINEIVSLQTGWDEVENAAAAVPGLNREPDVVYRIRTGQLTALRSTDSVEAVRAGAVEPGCCG